MREAMYGWMTLQLKGEGDGSPVAEPAFQADDPEALRCYPGQTRPDDWVTIPRFAAALGRELLEGAGTRGRRRLACGRRGPPGGTGRKGLRGIPRRARRRAQVGG